MTGVDLVRTEEIGKSYPRAGGVVVALDGVSLSIARGSFTAIMGPSGSGKSTLLSLLGLLDRPSRGRLMLDGQDVATLDDRSASRLRNAKMGFLFQSFNLIPQLSVIENVESVFLYGDRPERAWRSRAMSLLERLGVAHRATHRPAELAGGEAQRVALARALANEPELVLADEPTGNLDSQTGAQVLDLLGEIVERGNAVVLVTHDPEVARRTDRIVELRDGRLVGERTRLSGSSP